jgi:hypothetical protein
MTPFKKVIVFVTSLLMLVTFIKLIGLFIPDKPAKYTIYAADRVYHCNQFNVAGRTIYFQDTNKKNICINGDYTLIYENN